MRCQLDAGGEMGDQDTAITRGVSLYSDHYAIIEQCARERRLRGSTFSPAVQFIIEEWQEQRSMLALLPESLRLELREKVQGQSRKEAPM
jgi:hypothetical protein